MRDRALIIFKNDRGVSPTIYLHDAGEFAPDFIADLAAKTGHRAITPDQAAERFLDVIRRDHPGAVALSVYDTYPRLCDAALRNDAAGLTAYAEDDAGLILVDTADYSWLAFGGYFAAAQEAAA